MLLKRQVIWQAIPLLIILYALLLSGCIPQKTAKNTVVQLKEIKSKGMNQLTDDDLFKKALATTNVEKIVLSDRTYRLTKCLSLPSNFTLEGNNANLIFENTDQTFLIGIEGKTQVSINGIKISLSRGHSKANTAILVRKSGNVNIENIAVVDSDLTGISAKDVTGFQVKNSSFSNLTTHNQKSVDGIYVGGYHNVQDVTIDNCHFKNIGIPGKRKKGFPDDGDGIHFLTATDCEVAHSFTVSNCTFINCTARGIKHQSGNNVIYENNEFDGCHIGISFALDRIVKDIAIIGNKVVACKNAFSSYSVRNEVYPDGLTLKENNVSDCEYFFRGALPTKDLLIENNVAERIRKCFFSGKVELGAFNRNLINHYATAKDPSFDMAIHLLGNSHHVEIQQNTFKVPENSTRTILLEKSVKAITIKRNDYSHLDRFGKSYSFIYPKKPVSKSIIYDRNKSIE